ncbi:MAG: hypothetical protein SFV20_10905 [Sphingopyxis sp.]|nr:hypothetical protein [Sphingopyxis sp.]
MAETLISRPDQNLRVAVGAAVVLHVVLLALLSVQWTRGERRFDNPPMEVDLIADTGPTSTAPEISETPPAAKLGEEEALSREAQTALPEPAPLPKPTPKAPAAKQPPSKAPPAKGPPTRRPNTPTGRLDGIAEGLGKEATKAPGRGLPATQTAAEVRKSIDVSIKGAVASRWNGCRVSGLDVDALKTTVKFRLTQSGGLDAVTSVVTIGQNDSNQFQVARHQECAKRAIELAAPFDLPAENYDFWRNYTLDFVKR